MFFMNLTISLSKFLFAERIVLRLMRAKEKEKQVSYYGWWQKTLWKIFWDGKKLIL